MALSKKTLSMTFNQWQVSFMLTVANKPSTLIVFMLSIVMLNVVMLSVIVLNVIILNVLTPATGHSIGDSQGDPFS
jgi:hypothetical protein